MSCLTAVQASNAAYAPSHLPVAIFTGGTSGIARAMAEVFARYTKGRAHIIIIGRNRATAESIIASFPKPVDPNNSWKHEFVSCDASLMSNVRSTCAALAERLPRINFLVLGAGYTSFISTEETSEGLDRQLALRYYSRYVFISSLLPLLTKTRQSGQDARVMSILGGGHAFPVNLEDLGLKKARSKTFGFGGVKAIVQSAGYNDLMMVVRIYFLSLSQSVAFLTCCISTFISISPPRIPQLRSLTSSPDQSTHPHSRPHSTLAGFLHHSPGFLWGSLGAFLFLRYISTLALP